MQVLAETITFRDFGCFTRFRTHYKNNTLPKNSCICIYDNFRQNPDIIFKFGTQHKLTNRSETTEN